MKTNNKQIKTTPIFPDKKVMLMDDNSFDLYVISALYNHMMAKQSKKSPTAKLRYIIKYIKNSAYGELITAELKDELGKKYDMMAYLYQPVFNNDPYQFGNRLSPEVLTWHYGVNFSLCDMKFIEWATYKAKWDSDNPDFNKVYNYFVYLAEVQRLIDLKYNKANN